MKPTTNSRDLRAIQGLCPENQRWIYLRERDGEQRIAIANFEPSKEDGLVGQHKKLVKRKQGHYTIFHLTTEQLSKMLGIKPKNKPKPKTLDDFWATVDTVKPKESSWRQWKGQFDDVPLKRTKRPVLDTDSLFDDDDDDEDYLNLAHFLIKGKKRVNVNSLFD